MSYTTTTQFSTEFFVLKLIGGYSVDSILEDLQIEADIATINKLKRIMVETEKAYYASPSDEDGETPEQQAVSDRILADGAREFAEVLGIEY